MMRKDEMDERFMSDEAVEDAVLRSLEESFDVVNGIAPSRDLWSGIEARIGARVLPLGGERVEVRSIRRRPPWLAMAAAAAFLVASTASVTYVFTKRLASPSAAPGVAAQVATTQPAPGAPRATPNEAANEPTRNVTTPDVAATAAPSQVASVVGADRARHVASDDDRGERTDRTEAVSRIVAHEPSASMVRYPVTGSDEARVTYDDEINRLHAVLESRREQLDPATVATVEQNLHIIDVAIEQARAALSKDPHSAMLNEQLDRTLAKKTQLLRAATLLPSA